MEKRQALSRSLIDSAEAREKPYRVWDTRVPGLFLRVQPSGTKTFNVQWAHRNSKALGRYPALTLEGARTRALAILNDASTAPDGVPAAAKPAGKSVGTFRQFIDSDYGPWATENLQRGDEAVARLKRVFAGLLDARFTDIDQRSVETILTARRRAGIEKATFNRDLATIKAALAKAVEWKLLATHPLTAIRPAKVDTTGVVRFLSATEEAALRKALANRKGHLGPMTLLALNTGLRRGELTQLRWSDIDFSGKRLTVRAGYAKSGKARYIPLNSEAIAVLEAYRKLHSGEILFDLHSIKTSWDTLVSQAKIQRLRFHDLRHTFASKLVQRGVDLNTVRELLGHGNITMTLRYAHLAPGHRAAAVAKLVSS